MTKKTVKKYEADVYPFYLPALFFRGAAKLMVWVTVILALLKVLCNYVLQLFFDFISNINFSYLISNFKLKYYQIRAPVTHTTNKKLRSFNDIVSVRTWSDGWARFNNFFAQFHIVVICCTLIVVMLVMYLLMVVLRHHSGEQQPIKDDHTAKELRKRIIHSLSAEMSIQFDDSKRVNEDEEQYKANIRAVSVAIHTRLNPNSHRIMQTYKVRFPKPSNKSEVDRIVRALNGFDENLNGLLRGRVDFGAMENNLRDVSLVFRGEREMAELENKQLKRVQRWAKKNPVDEEKAVIHETEYAFSLDLFKDNSGSIEELRKKATEWAEKTKKSLDIVLNSDSIQATIKSVNVGNTTIQYVYTMPFSHDYSKVLSMDEKIENAVSIGGVQVNLDAGDLAISIPSPQNVHIPIDVPSMIESVYNVGGKA